MPPWCGVVSSSWAKQNIIESGFNAVRYQNEILDPLAITVSQGTPSSRMSKHYPQNQEIIENLQIGEWRGRNDLPQLNGIVAFA